MTGVLEVMNEEAKVEQVGQIWNKEENPINGRIYSQEGISPTLMTPTSGSFEPKILLDMEKPKSCASRQRGDKHKLETRKDDVANCVTSIDTDSMVAEPLRVKQATKQGYIECPIGGVFDASYPTSELRRGRVQENGEVSPALTTNSEGAVLRYEGMEPAVLTNRRTEEGKELRKHGIEKFENRKLVPREDGCSGALTTVQKDNLLQEPSFLRAAMGFGKPAEQDIPSAVTSSAYADNNFVKEPKIVGYSRDSKGKIVSRHLKDEANTIIGCNLSGSTATQYVAEVASELKEIASESRSCEVDVTINPDNSLRPYNAETKAKDGISEYVTQHEDNSANTVTSAHGGNVYGNATRYRIRKLTEREVFRLMDVSEEDIDKIQAAGISKTAMYKLAGNSIVVSCLYHLFRKMFVQPECETQQLSLF